MPSIPDTRLRALFDVALDLPEGEREAFLVAECAGDPDALTQLRELLAIDAQLENRTMRPLAPELTRMVAATSPAESLVGLRVGTFELCAELGRGGMGSVYRATRVDGTVMQQVAIKFVRRELLDANTLRRFQLERQTLASLDHPNIARLLDAAELGDGTPYFVMEYVAGKTITEHCDQAQLDLRARVALFRIVCAAVMYAHRNLVVHRDLKPGNILVSAAGVPKLLDFGIAKPLTTGIEIHASDQTGTAQRYFSPQYSAPEQLLGSPVGVGCDVYALGLLLYELLSGARPFDFTGLSSGQVERLVTTVPPAAPSNSAARIGASSLKQRQLRGDLDGIVLRCLRKAASERYASVEQLDADLGNYLDGRPVTARGGHGWYRAQKFVLRNKVAVLGSGLLLSSLVVGIVAFAWQARIARQRSAELELVSKFQADMLGQVDPAAAGQLLSKDIEAQVDQALLKAGLTESDRNAQQTAFTKQWRHVNATDAARNLIDNTILQPAAIAIDTQFKDQPNVDATLRQVLADRYRQMGLHDASLKQQVRALDIRRRLLGNDHPDTLYSVNSMGALLRFSGKLREAEVYGRELLMTRRRVLGNDHADTLVSVNFMCDLLVQESKLDEAEPYCVESLEASRRVLGEDHVNTIGALANLGGLRDQQGKTNEAAALWREALPRSRRVLGEEHAYTLDLLSNVASVLMGQGKHGEAETYLREAVRKSRRAFGEDHPRTLDSIGNLGFVLFVQNRPGEAEPYFREVLTKSRTVLGAEHQSTIISIITLGKLLQSQGKLSEAEALFQEGVAASGLALEAEHPLRLATTNLLAALHLAQGLHAQAVALLAPAEPVHRKLFQGENAFRLGQFLSAFGQAQAGLHQFSEAEAKLLEAHSIFVKVPGPVPSDIRECVRAVAALYLAWNQAQPARHLADKASDWERRLKEHDAPTGVATDPKLASKAKS